MNDTLFNPALNAMPTEPSTTKSRLIAASRALLPGVLLTALIGGGAIPLSQLPWFEKNGLSALTLAIVIGIIAGNTLYPRIAAHAVAGVTFSKATLLRAGIILYGLRLTFADIAHMGLSGILIDALVLGSTFFLACLIGTRCLKLDSKTAMLIGAGSSICGAAAVMASEPVIRGRPDQVVVAVATVVVFGTAAIFLYPMLFHWATVLMPGNLSEGAFGIYAGSTIHEVAQVVAAGRAVSEQAANMAVIAKMVRVMMLAPFLIILSAYLARRGDEQPSTGEPSRARIVIPWFAFAFVAVAGLNSFSILPSSAVHYATAIDTLLLAMAMAALGLTTHVSAIRKAGVRPLLLAALLFVWLIGGGFAINWLVTRLFA